MRPAFYGQPLGVSQLAKEYKTYFVLNHKLLTLSYMIFPQEGFHAGIQQEKVVLES